MYSNTNITTGNITVSDGAVGNVITVNPIEFQPGVSDVISIPSCWEVPAEPVDKIRVKAIAAIGNQNQLALGNNLPWRFPEDIEMFQDKIRDKVVIMGRLTYEAIPQRTLSQCQDIIVITSLDLEDVEVAEDLPEAIGMAEEMEADEVWICGGERVYKEALGDDLIHELHLSHIPYDGEADRFFPHFVQKISGILKDETIFSPSNNISFKVKVYNLEEVITPNVLFEQPLSPIIGDLNGPGGPMPSPFHGGVTWRPPGTPMSDMNNGDVFMDVNQNMQMFSDGELHTLTDTVTISLVEEAEAIVREVSSDYVGMIMGEDTFEAMSFRIKERLHQEDPYAQVEVNFTSNTSSPVPVMALGQMTPVDYSPTYITNTVHCTGIFRGQQIDIMIAAS